MPCNLNEMKNVRVQQSGKDTRLVMDFGVLLSGNSLGMTTQPAQLVPRSRFEHGSSLTQVTQPSLISLHVSNRKLRGQYDLNDP